MVGAMPALNARPQSQLNEWLDEISTTLAAARAAHPNQRIAPYAINQIIHESNDRLGADMEVCARYKVPYIITSLRAPNEVVARVHGWGGKVFHDVTTLRHAEKALEAGVDGLILVCAGAGGHAGTLSPFALLADVRRIFDGPIALAGAITTGADIWAAQTMGADFAYMGTRFIATAEANAADAYKLMIVESRASDILYTPFFTGIPGNYLTRSITACGLDPANLPADKQVVNAFSGGGVKVWKDVWGAGQGVSGIDSVEPIADLATHLRAEYAHARNKVAAGDFPRTANSIQVNVADGVAELTINRPQARNVLTADMYVALGRALQQADQNPAVNAIILTGAGAHFTAGNDLRTFQSGGPDALAGVNFLHILVSVQTPLVVAVEGYAIGIGTTLLQHCDLVFVAEDAQLRLPFVNLGLCPEGAASTLLATQVGPRIAADWLLTGRFITGREAADAGLANTATAPGQALARARDAAKALVAQPRDALRLTKAMMRRATAELTHSTIDYEAQQFSLRLSTAEAQGALKQFFSPKASG
jgi:nitronate monooxygenase